MKIKANPVYHHLSDSKADKLSSQFTISEESRREEKRREDEEVLTGGPHQLRRKRL